MKCLKNKHFKEVFVIIDQHGNGAHDAKKLLKKVIKNEGGNICSDPGKEPGYQTLSFLGFIERDKGCGLHYTAEVCEIMNKRHNLGLMPSYNSLLKLVDCEGSFRCLLSSKQRKSFRNWVRGKPWSFAAGYAHSLKTMRKEVLLKDLKKRVPNFPC